MATVARVATENHRIINRMGVAPVELRAGNRLAGKVPAGMTKRQVALPLLIFAAGFSLYGFCVLGAVLATGLGAKIGLSILGGVFIANLAIIGHDGVHKSFTRLRWLHYRFMRNILGQPFFYMVDIWLPNMFLPTPQDTRRFSKTDWADLGLVYLWLLLFVVGLAEIAQAYSAGAEGFMAALANAALFGFLIPVLVWNLFISFVTIVQHTSPKARWILPTGRLSTYEQKLRGTVHVGFPEIIDWFFHRVMQHLAHHVNPVIPLYVLKSAERDVIAQAPEPPVIEVWTPMYHWRLARDCKLYDPARDCWCGFNFQPTGERRPTA
jgi:fatty acid desaturase